MKLKDGSQHPDFRASFFIMQMTFPLLSSLHTKSTWNGGGLLFPSSNKNSAYLNHSSFAYFLLLFSSSLKLSFLHPVFSPAPWQHTETQSFSASGSKRPRLLPPFKTQDSSYYWWSWGRVSWGSVEAEDFQMLWKFEILHVKKKVRMQSVELQG